MSARLPELLPFLVVSAPLDPLEPAVGVEAARAGAADWAPGRGWSGPGVVVAVVIGAGAPAVLTGSVQFVCNIKHQIFSNIHIEGRSLLGTHTLEV